MSMQVGINLAQKTASWIKATGRSIISASKPINPAELKSLRYSRNLNCDTVSFTTKKLQELNKTADDVLAQVKKGYNAEYIEKNFPEVVENVKAGKIQYQDELNYYNYKRLEDLRNSNPEVFTLIGAEKGSAFNLRTMMSSYGDDAINTAREMPVDDIKKVFAEVDDLAQKYDFEPAFEHYMNMLIMKKHNPRTYEYMISKQPFLVESWGSSFDLTPSSTMLKKITPEQIEVITKDRLPQIKHIGEYVYSSDNIVNNKLAIQELSESLSKCKLSTDVNLFRGDKTVGMFDNVSIDKGLEQKIRQLLETHKAQAQNTKITEYTGRYNCSPTTNLYDFLSSKETLTLADAMQVVKYGDDAFLNEIKHRIQNAKITDTRFKSYSFDEGMAASWRGIHAGDNTTIIQNATIKKGTQGGYHNGSNAQFEVILNNTQKELSFPSVVYNKETDTFILNTLVRNI